MLKKVTFSLLLMVLVAFFAACDPYQPTLPTTFGLQATLPTTPPTEVNDSTAPFTGPSDMPVTTIPVTSAHVHSYVARQVVPGCMEQGYLLHECTCGDSFFDQYVDALGHDWSAWSVAVEPTQIQEGKQVRACCRCGCEDVQILPPLQPTHTHFYSEEPVAPTCTQSGYMLYLCSCGDSYQDEVVDPLGHDWGEWDVVTEPTVETEGIMQRHCIRCNASDSTSVEKLPPPHTHNYQKEKVPATCTEAGYYRYSCGCGEFYDEVTSQPKGHVWNTWYVSVLPTTQQEGQRQRLCSLCGETENGLLDVLAYEGAFIIVAWPETIGRNVVGTVIILGTPGTEYNIDVYYKSGVSSAKGLENKIADENGYVVWTWKVGPSTAGGTYKIIISGGNQEQMVLFTVVVE